MDPPRHRDVVILLFVSYYSNTIIDFNNLVALRHFRQVKSEISSILDTLANGYGGECFLTLIIPILAVEVSSFINRKLVSVAVER